MAREAPLLTFLQGSSGARLAGLAVLVGLYLTSLYSFLLFHAFAELFSIVVACGIFIIGWNTRQYIKSNYLVFLSVTYLFVGFLDLLHTLAYKGMGIFTDYDFHANQLWIATRSLESVSLLVAMLFIDGRRRFNPHYLFVLYTVITALIVASIFHWKIFPVCFVEGQGQTPFKIYSEYVICAILGAVIFVLRNNRHHFDEDIYRFLLWAFSFTIISELAFTFYISNYGFSNLVGHYFKIFSFFMVYRAIIETGLRRPHDMIFRQLLENQERLREARDAADRANKTKSEFLANMSHEIRTPLNGLLGMLQLLKMTPLQEEQQDYVHVAETSGRSLLEIINDILDLSKIEAGHLEIQEERVNLRELLETITSLFSMQAKAKNVEIVCAAAPDTPGALLLDGVRLRQILFNLVGNAVKFTDAGRVELRARVLAEDGGAEAPGASDASDAADAPPRRGTLVLEVEDTGEGIPEDKQQSVFAPFTQAGRSHQRSAQGTGLGLTIVSRLLALMGGEVTLRSTVGEGSNFTVRIPVGIPVRETVADTPHPGLEVPAHQDIEHEEHRPLTVLIADDDRVSLLAARRYLEKLGNYVVTASNGREALQALDRGAVDIVLMDVQMPEMDGLEATRRIRSSSQGYAGVPIVGLSGNAFKEDGEQALATGMNEYLTKPLVFADLVRVIHCCVSGEDCSSPER
jgi:signal transduction histidine kinase/ActR/RegA family two-component response regulator